MASLPEEMFSTILSWTAAQLLDNKAFVVPSFQRDFSWEKEHFTRFFEDVVSDINHSDSGTFMGSIICTKDQKALDEQLEKNRHSPTAVWQVVDGQQRLSFLTLLATAIHEYINLFKLKDKEKWLQEAVEGINVKITDIISVSLTDRDKTKNPKIIKEYYDYWSLPTEEPSFKSPIARMLNKYISHINLPSGSKFEYDVPNKKEDGSKEHGFLKDRREEIRDLLIDVCAETEVNLAIKLNRIIENKELMTHIFKSCSDNVERSRVYKSIEEDGEIKRVFYALALGHYILEHMYVIFIPMKTDLNKTFVVFDALNTTGSTLNAYETFRPEVIKRNKDSFSSSPDKAHLDEIDRACRDIPKKQRDRHVNDLIIAFAAANSGNYPGKKIGSQRKYLRDSYRQYDTRDATEFLRLFSVTSQMLGINHSGEEIRSYIERHGKSLAGDEKLNRLAGKASFCLHYLKDAKFSVTLALFTCYLWHMHEERFSSASIEMFCKCILKTASFFTIWRSCRDTTDSIDDVFRSEIMTDFSRRDAGDSKYSNLPGIDELGIRYIKILDNHENLDKLAWKKSAGEVEIDRIKQVAKFVLLTGTHGTQVKLKDGAPFLEVVKDGADIITAEGFRRSAFASVEHILPQSKYKGKIYRQLWNLTLLPTGINAILTDKPWNEKKRYYKALSSQTSTDEQQIIKEIESALAKQGRTTSKKFKEFMENDEGSYLHMTKFLGMIPEDDFDADIGQRRIDNTLDNCWNLLVHDWLDFPKSQES